MCIVHACISVVFDRAVSVHDVLCTYHGIASSFNVCLYFLLHSSLMHQLWHLRERHTCSRGCAYILQFDPLQLPLFLLLNHVRNEKSQNTARNWHGAMLV